MPVALMTPNGIVSHGLLMVGHRPCMKVFPSNFHEALICLPKDAGSQGSEVTAQRSSRCGMSWPDLSGFLVPYGVCGF